MPTLSITKNYSDGDILTESDLDAIKSSIETFVNTTKLDSNNLQSNAVVTATLTDLSVTRSKIEAAERIPTGCIQSYVGASAPTGWLLCHGGTVSRTTYADLYAVIGDKFGEGDGSTTFDLPDLRGRFLRGWDNSAGNDPDSGSRTAIDGNSGASTGDNIGSYQSDQFKSHTHSLNAGTAQAVLTPGGNNIPTLPSTSGAAGGNETRPVNVYVNYIIKY